MRGINYIEGSRWTYSHHVCSWSAIRYGGAIGKYHPGSTWNHWVVGDCLLDNFLVQKCSIDLDSVNIVVVSLMGGWWIISFRVCIVCRWYPDPGAKTAHSCMFTRTRTHTHGQKHSDVHAGTRTPNNRPCSSLFKVFVDLVHVQYHMSLCELLVFGLPLGWTWSLAGTWAQDTTLWGKRHPRDESPEKMASGGPFFLHLGSPRSKWSSKTRRSCWSGAASWGPGTSISIPPTTIKPRSTLPPTPTMQPEPPTCTVTGCKSLKDCKGSNVKKVWGGDLQNSWRWFEVRYT